MSYLLSGMLYARLSVGLYNPKSEMQSPMACLPLLFLEVLKVVRCSVEDVYVNIPVYAGKSSAVGALPECPALVDLECIHVIVGNPCRETVEIFVIQVTLLVFLA